MICNKDFDCVKYFLQYPQELLSYTHKEFGYSKKINIKSNKIYIQNVQMMFSLSKKQITDFIVHWNNAPKYCCLETSKRPGKCVGIPAYCNEEGRQMSRRVRDVSCLELVDIKKRAGIIDQESECLDYPKNCCDLKYGKKTDTLFNENSLRLNF